MATMESDAGLRCHMRERVDKMLIACAAERDSFGTTVT